MTAPDADSTSGRPIPPEALATGQRMLAAIVFTDTVGFSALMRKEEERTLRLVARDLAYMKTTCEAFGGQVLKSTGDGLLMLFTSAVQAVACALEIQRDLQKQYLELPRDERLQHRIGIHLGDVFQSGGDVMGDGVNIAARLQTEAVPGGICLSQTVYDVVNNRLPFYVNNLGARTLKNIGKVTAYQISPADGAQTNAWLSWYHWRTFMSGYAGWLLLPLVLIVFWLGMHREWASHHRGEKGSFTLLPLSPETPAHPAVAAPLVPSTASTPEVSASTKPSANVTEVTQTEFQNTAFHYMLAYDFGGMETWIKQHDWPGKSSSKLAETCPRLSHLVAWAHQQLQRYTIDKPLKVVAKERTFYYWPAAFSGVREKMVLNDAPAGAGKATLLGPDQIPPMIMHNIIRQLLKDDPEPPDDTTVELEKELHLFIETYHLVFPNRNVQQTVAAPVAPAGPAP